MAENPQTNELEAFDDDEIGIGRKLKKKKPSLSLKGAGFAVLVLALAVSSFWISFYLGKLLLSPSGDRTVAARPPVKKLKPPAADEVALPEFMPPAEKKPVLVKQVKEDARSAKAPAAVKKTAAKEVKRDIFYPESKKPAVKKAPAVVKAPAKTPVKKAAVPAPAAKAKPSAPVAVKKPAAKKAEGVKKSQPAGSMVKVRVTGPETREEALEIREKMASGGFEAVLVKSGGGSYSVQAGAFKDKANAEKLAQRLKEKGFSGTIVTE